MGVQKRVHIISSVASPSKTDTKSIGMNVTYQKQPTTTVGKYGMNFLPSNSNFFIDKAWKVLKRYVTRFKHICHNLWWLKNTQRYIGL
jgi:hypothetical protein